MTIDLADITTKTAFHELVKKKLQFPDWYGVSWDAFWDCVIAVVDMPDTLTFINWEAFAEACPRDIDILRDIMVEFAETKAPKQIVLGQPDPDSQLRPAMPSY
ncbi:barstar family protein [Spirosoma luteolum]